MPLVIRQVPDPTPPKRGLSIAQRESLREWLKEGRPTSVATLARRIGTTSNKIWGHMRHHNITLTEWLLHGDGDA